jgi:hypothetical protein
MKIKNDFKENTAREKRDKIIEHKHCQDMQKIRKWKVSNQV